jgi:hypothetical protein
MPPINIYEPPKTQFTVFTPLPSAEPETPPEPVQQTEQQQAPPNSDEPQTASEQ